RNTGQDVTRGNLLTRLHGDNRVHRQQVPGIATTLGLGYLAAASDRESRLEAFATLARTPVDDHALGEAGRLVGVLGNRGTVDEILEHHLALDFGEDRTGVGVPFGQTLAAADLVAFLDEQLGAVGHLVGGPFLAVGIEDGERDVTGHDHLTAALDGREARVANGDG